MTRDEFIQGLKDDVFYDDFEKHSLERFKYVKWYIDNEVNFVINGVKIGVVEPYSDEGMKLTNLAFEQLRKKYGHQ